MTAASMPSALPMLTLAQAQAMLPGSRLLGDGNTAFWRVHTDTRSLQVGDLFVALRGEHFDAHDFLPQATAAGAAAVLAERGVAGSGLPGLEVPDALLALQQLATAWRARLQLPVIAVTGSNGKTTVTQMIASILRAWVGEGAALATAGNLNNHIGVPLSVLRLRQDASQWHRAAVLELGMNHPGEIARLAAIAQPTVALVNNAQREHLEFMATVDAVAAENGAVISALPAQGTAVFLADEAYAPLWTALAGPRSRLSFATPGAADVTGAGAWITPEGWDGEPHWALHLQTPAGSAECPVYAPGQHNLLNALAAAASALAAGAPLAAVAQGLQAFRPVAGRSQSQRLQLNGLAVTLVNDSYNANPDSVRAAIRLLASLPGPRWLVLGDMGEVGDQGPAFHTEVGGFARSAGLDHCWTVGPLCAHAAAAFGAAGRHFDNVPALIAALANAPACASVLVKGSRFMRMETVVAALARRGGPAALVQPQLKDGHAA